MIKYLSGVNWPTGKSAVDESLAVKRMNHARLTPRCKGSSSSTSTTDFKETSNSLNRRDNFQLTLGLQQRVEEWIPYLVKMIRVSIHVLTSSGQSVLNDDDLGLEASFVSQLTSANKCISWMVNFCKETSLRCSSNSAITHQSTVALEVNSPFFQKYFQGMITLPLVYNYRVT